MCSVIITFQNSDPLLRDNWPIVAWSSSSYLAALSPSFYSRGGQFSWHPPTFTHTTWRVLPCTLVGTFPLLCGTCVIHCDDECHYPRLMLCLTEGGREGGDFTPFLCMYEYEMVMITHATRNRWMDRWWAENIMHASKGLGCHFNEI